MRKLFVLFFLFILFFYSGGVYAQVTIGSGVEPNIDALLELKENPDGSSTRGFLLSRMNTKTRDAIESPTESLLIWNTDTQCFNFWKSGMWFSLCGDPVDATYTIDCNNMVVKGTYTAGTELKSTNSLVLPLKVSRAGNANFSVNVNGMTFSSGDITLSAADNTVTLNGSGIPLKSGNSIVSLTSSDRTTCSATITVVPQQAAYSVNDYSSVKVNGAYIVGTPLTSTNTITLDVVATKAGTASMATSLNGMTFSSGDINLTVGKQTITLKGSGTPTKDGTNTVPIYNSDGESACSATISVNPKIPPVLKLISYSAPTWIVSNVKSRTRYTKTVELTVESNVDWTYDVNTSASQYPSIFYKGSGTVKAGTNTITLTLDESKVKEPTEAKGNVAYEFKTSIGTLSFNVYFFTPQMTIVSFTKSGIYDPFPSSGTSKQSDFFDDNVGPGKTINTDKEVKKVGYTSSSNFKGKAIRKVLEDLQPDIIIFGYNADKSIDEDGVNALTDYVNAKRGFMMLATEYSAARIEQFLVNLMGPGSSCTVRPSAPTSGFPSGVIKEINEPLLNGSFGTLTEPLTIAIDWSNAAQLNDYNFPNSKVLGTMTKSSVEYPYCIISKTNPGFIWFSDSGWNSNTVFNQTLYGNIVENAINWVYLNKVWVASGN